MSQQVGGSISSHLTPPQTLPGHSPDPSACPCSADILQRIKQLEQDQRHLTQQLATERNERATLEQALQEGLGRLTKILKTTIKADELTFKTLIEEIGRATENVAQIRREQKAVQQSLKQLTELTEESILAMRPSLNPTEHPERAIA